MVNTCLDADILDNQEFTVQVMLAHNYIIKRVCVKKLQIGCDQFGTISLVNNNLTYFPKTNNTV
jgi:hypothetical protein